jgi:hypothetical protein
MPTIPCVSLQDIWKILELFRILQISTVYNVDFNMDFKRKKFPDIKFLRL